MYCFGLTSVLSEYFPSCLRALLVLSKYHLFLFKDAACTVKVPPILYEDAVCTVKVLTWCTWKLHQPLLLSVSKYAVQSTINPEGVALFSVSNVLSKYQHLLRESHQPLCRCQVSPNMLFKAPLILRELHFSVSPMYCQSTNTYWGSHVILAARCFSNCTVKVPTLTEGVTVGCLQICCQSTNILLRELYLFPWLVSKYLLPGGVSPVFLACLQVSSTWGCFTCLLSLFPSISTWGSFTCLLSLFPSIFYLGEFHLFAVKPVSSFLCLLSHFSFHLRLYKC